MYKLTVSFGGKVVERRDVDAPRITVGRSQDCDIVIDNLGISRQHTEIVREGGAYVVRDLKSNNGTFVNGKRVTRHNLNDGDEIAIGKFTIAFHQQPDALPPEPAGAVPEPDAAGGGDFTLAMDSRLMAERYRERASKLKAYLLVEDGDKKKPIVLDKSVFTIGKKNCDVTVAGFFVAKKHAIIFRDEAGFRLVDTSQRRRTYLNDGRIDEERLKDGDIIKVGGQKFQFMVGTPVV